MKLTTILDKSHQEEIIIYAHEKNDLIEKIEQMVLGEEIQLNGYLRGEIVKLDINDIYIFTLEDGKLYAVCENEKYLIKSRLYNIEEKLGNNFIKINQSSIANISKISKFDVSIGGVLKVIFKNGYADYVSRRNIKTVKQRMGL